VWGCRTPALARLNAADRTDLRAGVGQAFKEETAGHAAMAINRAVSAASLALADGCGLGALNNSRASARLVLRRHSWRADYWRGPLHLQSLRRLVRSARQRFPSGAAAVGVALGKAPVRLMSGAAQLKSAFVRHGLRIEVVEWQGTERNRTHNRKHTRVFIAACWRR